MKSGGTIRAKVMTMERAIGGDFPMTLIAEKHP
jgi:hypothetical protein